jgi:hypothetical protein
MTQLSRGSLRVLYKHAERVQFTSPCLRGEVGSRALRSFRVRGKTPRPFMDAGPSQDARHPNPLPRCLPIPITARTWPATPRASPPPGAMSRSTAWRPNVAWRVAIPSVSRRCSQRTQRPPHWVDELPEACTPSQHDCPKPAIRNGDLHASLLGQFGAWDCARRSALERRRSYPSA